MLKDLKGDVTDDDFIFLRHGSTQHGIEHWASGDQYVLVRLK
jgi:hypothetical protein